MNKEIIAHRCNSIEKIKHALSSNAHRVEFDVRKNQNNKLILAHSFYSSSSTSLTEALNLLSNKMDIDVEIKSPGYESEIYKCINKHYKGHVLYTSRNLISLQKIKSLDPQASTGYIISRIKTHNLVPNVLRNFLGIFPKSDIFSAIISPYELTTKSFLRNAKKNNIPVYIWAIKSKSALVKSLKNNHIHGVITQRPHLAVKLNS